MDKVVDMPVVLRVDKVVDVSVVQVLQFIDGWTSLRSCSDKFSLEQWKCLRFSSSPESQTFQFDAETGTHSANCGSFQAVVAMAGF